MLNFQFQIPTNYVFGRGVEHQVGELLVQEHIQNVLIVYDESPEVRLSLMENVEKALLSEHISFIKMGGVLRSPQESKVYEGIELCRGNHIDFVLAVGGGSVIDTAKAIAIGVPYDGDFWDIFTGRYTPTQALPIGVILTVASSGSESSANCVITNKSAGMVKLTYRGASLLRPRFALLNPELTFTLPKMVTFGGIVDMFVHVMERYMTNTKEVSLTDRMCEGLLRSIMEMALRLLNDPMDYEARANVMWAGTMAHNDICGVGRESDWSARILENEVCAKFGVMHSEALAVVFPAWLQYVAMRSYDVSEGNPKRVAQFAIRVMHIVPETLEKEVLSVPSECRRVALSGVLRLRAFFTSLGLPIRLSEISKEPMDTTALAESIHAVYGETIGTFVKLKKEDTKEIFDLCM